jgi:hypothetical protein
MLKKFLYGENGGVAEQAVIIGLLVIIGAAAFLTLRGYITDAIDTIGENLIDSVE